MKEHESMKTSIWLIWQPCKYGPFQTFETDILGHHHCRLSGLNVPALPQETMAPRKDKTLRATISHNSPVYLKSVSNFKATLRRRESQRFIKREQVRIHSVTSSTQIASAKFFFSNTFPRWDKEQWDRTDYQEIVITFLKTVTSPNIISSVIRCMGKLKFRR